MESLVAFLAILGLMVLWIYFNFPPKNAEKNALFIFNLMVVFICVLLCGAWIWNVAAILGGSTDDKYVKPMAIAGALGIEVIFLGIAFVLRNFWIFKRPPGAY